MASEELVTLDILSSAEGAGRGRSSSWYWVSHQDAEVRHSQHKSGQGHTFLPWPVLKLLLLSSLSLVHINVTHLPEVGPPPGGPPQLLQLQPCLLASPQLGEVSKVQTSGTNNCAQVNQVYYCTMQQCYSEVYQ